MPDKYFGKYLGTVQDNLDPQVLGRLRVCVPTIDEKDDQLWAVPALPYGFFFVPEVGHKVWVEFEGGDLRSPVWTGIHYVAGEWPEAARESAPQRRVIKSAAGNVIILKDESGEAGIEISSHARIVIRALGTIEIQAPNVIINGRAVVPQPKPI